MKLSEEQECILVREYLDLLQQQGKVVIFTHIPNSTYTPFRNVRMKNKRMGVNPGFPDYIILTKNNTLFLEMKISKGGVVSPFQKVWIEALTQKRHPVYVAKGFDDAKQFIDRNL